MAVRLVPVKENAREAPAPYKDSCCQGWLQEPQPPSLLQLTLPDCNTVRCQSKPSMSFPMVLALQVCQFCFYALLGTEVQQMDEDLHVLLLCNKDKTAVADAHIYLYLICGFKHSNLFKEWKRSTTIISRIPRYCKDRSELLSTNQAHFNSPHKICLLNFTVGLRISLVYFLH